MGNGSMEFMDANFENYSMEIVGGMEFWEKILEIDFNVGKVGKRDECMEVPVESHGNVIFSVTRWNVNKFLRRSGTN